MKRLVFKQLNFLSENIERLLGRVYLSNNKVKKKNNFVKMSLYMSFRKHLRKMWIFDWFWLNHKILTLLPVSAKKYIYKNYIKKCLISTLKKRNIVSEKLTKWRTVGAKFDSYYYIGHTQERKSPYFRFKIKKYTLYYY